MRPFWKISGEFFGWSSDSGEFFNSEGLRKGTIYEGVLYDHNGLYVGELIQEQYIGKQECHNDWIGTICLLEGKVFLEPMIDRIGIEVVGFDNPKEL